jgi:hypothetical protein
MRVEVGRRRGISRIYFRRADWDSGVERRARVSDRGEARSSSVPPLIDESGW